MKTIETAALTEWLQQRALTDPENRIQPEVALDPELANVRIYDEPLVRFADAADPLFAKLKEPDVVGPIALLPQEYLPGAKSVISCFYPFSKTVRESNYEDSEVPGNGWLHGRIEGQDYLRFIDAQIIERVQDMGGQAVAPAIDERTQVVIDFACDPSVQPAQSSWSERHVAHIAGLGTFSLTRGLITEKGVAGRFCSVITTLPVDEVSKRPYKGVYDWCIRCGECIARCPVDAISLEKGKDQLICGTFVKGTQTTYAPRYGCGKCQTKVACEYCRP